MSFLRFSVPQRRKSLIPPRRPYHSPTSLTSSYLLPQLSNQISEKESIPQKKEVCNISSRCSTKVYNGEPLIDNDMPKSLIFSSYKNILKGDITIQPLSPLPSPNEPTFNSILKQKIKICNIIFNFCQPQVQCKGKWEKSKSLNEISSIMFKKPDYTLLSDQEKDLILNMISNNLFEQDPFISNKNIASSTIKLTFTESSWEHLSIVFKILNQFVLIFPEKCKFDLINKCIRLMNIPDSNERDNLVIFLMNYTKVHHDQFDDIWKEIKCALTNVQYDIYNAYCVEPILTYMSNQLLANTSFFCSKYLSKILKTHLLPLLDNERLSLYFNKLSNLIIQVAEGNNDDQLNVIQYLIKHFPIQNSQKQPLFVSILSSISSTMNYEQLNPIADKIFNFIAMSISSPNYKLADSALSFLMKPNMKPIIFSNYESAMSILHEPLRMSSYFYWEKSIKDQSSAVLSALMNAKINFEQNIALSDFVDDKNTNKSQKIWRNIPEKKDLAQTWASLSRMAAKRDNSIDLTKTLYNIRIEFTKEKIIYETKSQNNSSDTINMKKLSVSTQNKTQNNFITNCSHSKKYS